MAAQIFEDIWPFSIQSPTFMALQLRTLVSGEEERLLELLDGWPFGDETRGSEFFRRYLEQDPSYRPENVWIAADGPQPVSCVQIFPRRMRVLVGAAMAKSRPKRVAASARCSPRAASGAKDLAGELLTLAAEAMKNRGFGISALLTTRVEWYQSHGWQPWCSHQWRLRVVEPEVLTAEPDEALRGRISLLETARPGEASSRGSGSGACRVLPFAPGSAGAR